MRKTVLFLIISLIAATEIKAQNIEVEGKVNDTKVEVGKPFTLDLSLKVPYGWFVEWNDFIQDTLSEQIDIIKRGNVERTADADSNVIVKQQLTLMTFDTGQIQLPAVGLTYAQSFDDPMRLQAFTEPIELYATTIVVDTLQPYKPIVEPIAAPIRMKDVFPWILVALLAILIGLGMWFFLKRRKAKVDENGNVVKGPLIPPYTKAIDDLKRLREEKMWQSGKVKEYFSSLTDIAREYIEGQFGVNAVEMTTDDIMEEIKPLHFSKEAYDKLKDTMEVADLVKFAKYSATALESDTCLNNMTDFVNESYAHYQKTLSPSASPQMEQTDCETQSSTVGKEDVKNA
ncbi:MAG: BatA domain-containing protein [Bacteroidales bacterium]|nr:BatA domain-containing protein [Bacteroidales bacterium]